MTSPFSFPPVEPGDRITSALIGRAIPVSAVKPADGGPIVSSTTLANDNDLFLPLKAGLLYELTGCIYVTGAASGSGGLTLAFTWPAGSGAGWGSWGLGVAGGANINAFRQITSGQSVTFGTSGATLVPCFIRGLAQAGISDFTLQAQVAQAISNATGTVVKAGSWIQAKPVGPSGF
jgi:hypothetical protein